MYTGCGCDSFLYFLKISTASLDQILEILKSVRPNVDFEHCEDLIGNGTLDSMDMVMIMTQIMQKFDLSIPPEEMVPENFNSAKAMYRLIQKLEDEE